MKTVTGSVVSSKPISISKAASTLSSFLSADNGASKALCAYLRRASDSFNELKHLHKELKSSPSVRKHLHHGSKVSNEFEAAMDNEYRVEDGDKKNSSVSEKKKRPDSKYRTTDKTSLRVQSDDEQSGKTAMENGGNGNLEDVSGKRKGGGLKIEIEDKPSGKVEMDVESSDVVAVEKKRKKHKKKSEDRHGDIEDDGRESGARLKHGKSQNTDNNCDNAEASGEFVENNVAKGKSRKKLEDKRSLGDVKDQVKSEDQRRGDIKEERSTDNDNGNGTDLVDLLTKKKKKRKQREEDDDFQKNSGEAMVKEEVPVLDSKELKRKEKKKSKNRELGEEGHDDGSEKQHSRKRRKG
ncbi:hypothetical protein IC582_026690 [Cucumis melo]|uniref:Uncharacterized protein LOC103501895 n=1 Tax=Cucumis melo TaxID=3656 RepID=A0ABM3KBF0_CUCME|nr:uncharacterized protein LOC103501895 [Cucumis melo]XP_050935109.1 uncharacterized protein LOC103501895 [Cucumis melo]XP_050935110.1 uncharacterized protein LOC103501895 [Cucumis melo]XP_050935111.1 uncharacterized protein LOC103501895 [Cucumis melo]XP_050935112.1 uncharacterized protein LOC103501895 [Cucumis melo]